MSQPVKVVVVQLVLAVNYLLPSVRLAGFFNLGEVCFHGTPQEKGGAIAAPNVRGAKSCEAKGWLHFDMRAWNVAACLNRGCDCGLVRLLLPANVFAVIR